MAAKKKLRATKARLVIAVLDRGWVFVGRIAQDSNGCHLSNAACIRYWGTTKGIGQLALEGPQAQTKLDEAGSVSVPATAVIALIAAAEDKWPGR